MASATMVLDFSATTAAKKQSNAMAAGTCSQRTVRRKSWARSSMFEPEPLAGEIRQGVRHFGLDFAGQLLVDEVVQLGPDSAQIVLEQSRRLFDLLFN